ncbi:hypothetical protein LN533_01020 [Xanthomonas vesicatoria]|uniref:Chemotaxis protein n=1 Tax=Xanthomonas vesicatoria TaxID=56460 RepID=A0ABS8L7T7_9XANT|nr:hypothetical protein [Xanthomonas vesicatoria]MCC8599772.1 hypothetical protein [Xanthomonas vesicatoria]MCC8608136.1 hypothetical protein [Xanthomonas vesicatoria]MCC8621247.1 hypothetical protein [Xanthomonas vesicatoria]MCC8672812.1 hypothetical protein [Xanthomonas vesicatoria]
MTSLPSHSRFGGRLAYRLMLGTAVIASLCFGLTAAISYWQSSRALIASAQTTMQSVARFQAEQVSNELGQAFVAGQSVASALLAQRAHGGISRDAAAAIVHHQLQNHPEWVGMGTLWEPQAFDGKDSAYVGAEGHDSTGRFMTYWAYNGQSLIREPLVGYEKPGDGDWNLKPRAFGPPDRGRTLRLRHWRQASPDDHLVHSGYRTWQVSRRGVSRFCPGRTAETLERVTPHGWRLCGVDLARRGDPGLA